MRQAGEGGRARIIPLILVQLTVSRDRFQLQGIREVPLKRQAVSRLIATAWFLRRSDHTAGRAAGLNNRQAWQGCRPTGNQLLIDRGTFIEAGIECIFRPHRIVWLPKCRQAKATARDFAIIIGLSKWITHKSVAANHYRVNLGRNATELRQIDPQFGLVGTKIADTNGRLSAELAARTTGDNVDRTPGGVAAKQCTLRTL